MNLVLLLAGLGVAGLLLLLTWSVRRQPSEAKKALVDPANLAVYRHVTNLPQIRQTLEPADIAYIKEHLCKKSERNVRRERRRIALRYLEALHEDFRQLTQTARIVASLSPEVEPGQEWKLFRLSLRFEWKYKLLRSRFALGSVGFPAMGELALVISSLAMDVERMINAVGAASAMQSETLADR